MEKNKANDSVKINSGMQSASGLNNRPDSYGRNEESPTNLHVHNTYTYYWSVD